MYMDNIISFIIHIIHVDGSAVSVLRRAIAKVKQRWSVIRWVTNNISSSYVLRKAR
jgi:hypothetical protein